MIQPGDAPVPSPNAVFREEFDDWGLLFDPDSGEVHGLNPVAAFVWGHLDGNRSVREIAALVAVSFDNAPETVEEDVIAFIGKLQVKGFLGHGAG